MAEKADIKTIVGELSSAQPEKRESALRLVLARREEAVPELLKILERVLAMPLGAPVTLDDWTWFLAAYLLAQFREKKAFPLLVKQFSLPPWHVERLFKDVLLEDLPRLLASLWGGDASPLRDLTENKEIHESVRASALWGYTILAAVKAVPKGELTDYYAELFQGKLERLPSQVWTTLVAGCAALHAVDLRKDVLTAYHEELTDASVFPLQEVEREWSMEPEESLKRLCEDSGGLIVDVWEEMKYWPGIEEEGKEGPEE